MNLAYLLLGSNEGNRGKWLKLAASEVLQQCGTIAKASSVYQTAAWGLETQPYFLNQVLVVKTKLLPLELLSAIQNIEASLGRQRSVKWGQRTLDIDILFYNTEVINYPELVVPHPHLRERRFALMPLAEIAPELIHPVHKKSIAQLLEQCPDKLEVKIYFIAE